MGEEGYTGVHNDFWQYDPISNNWSQKENFKGDAREGTGQFAITNYGYVGFGFSTTKNYNDLWQYNTLTNTWSQLKDCPGPARTDMITFSIGNFGYIGTGNGGEYADIWKFNL